MKSSTKRDSLKFISYLQILGIILVVVGHSMHMYPDGTHGTATIAYRAIYSFHMPLFLFISGFLLIYTILLKNKLQQKSLQFFISKFKRLIIPFITLTVVTFVPRCMMSGFADDYFELSWKSFGLAFIDSKFYPIPYFWYITANFLLLITVFYTLFYTVKLGINIKYSLWLLFIAFVVINQFNIQLTSIWALNEIKRIGLFFLLGGIYCLYSKTINRVIPWSKKWFFLLCIICWALSFTLIHDSNLFNICAFLGITMCISLARILTNVKQCPLDHLVGANYLIFLLSWYCNVCAQQLLAHFISIPWWTHSILSIIAGIYIPWLGYKYLQTHQHSNWVKTASFLLGQTFPSNHR